MTTWYKVTGIRWSFSTPNIEAHEVVKDTPSRVVFENKKWENKVNDYHRWFDTYEAAYVFAVSVKERKIQELEEEVRNIRHRLTLFKKANPAPGAKP